MSRRSSSALLGAVLVGASLAAQDVDWGAKVKNAVENPRYALRRAISNDIARAGDAAVPAIVAYAKAHGGARIPLLLVDAIARVDAGADATLALLRGWADDGRFYWRAQALGALARRALEADAGRFEAAREDPSHLFRVAGARGLHALARKAGAEWTAGREVLVDADPRARVLLALALWEAREPAALPALVAALADDRAFLDDAWGRRYALQVHQALRRAANTDFGYQPGATLADNAVAIAKVAAWAEVPVPPLLSDEGTGDRGGLEIRSCRHGDLFVRWTDHEVHFGLDRSLRVPLPAKARADLLEALAAVLGSSNTERETRGEVVCDYLQFQSRVPLRLWRMAPGAVTSALATWCERVATALETLDHPDAAAALRTRLPQFVGGG